MGMKLKKLSGENLKALDDSLEYLWRMIQQSFYTKSRILPNAERANLIAYYEHLHSLILAISIVNVELERPKSMASLMRSIKKALQLCIAGPLI